MKFNSRFKVQIVVTILVGVIILILYYWALFSSRSDPIDPKNSVNAIYLEEIEITSERFTRIYVSREGETKIEIYKDNEHKGCELIIVTVYPKSSASASVSIEYVTHVVRDPNIRIKP